MDGIPLTNPLAANITLSLTDARIALKGSPSVVFNPDSLFAPTDGGGVIDISDMSTCFQDDAGTVVVTAVGQVVRSIRARNRPTFLMVLSPTDLEATYELDPQGFPALQAAVTTSLKWAYYLKGDGGLPVTDFSIIMSSMGSYGSGDTEGVGTGWSLFGNSTGDYGTPYDYAGVYTVQPSADRAEIKSTLDGGFEAFPVVENIDDRPYVLSTRSAAGEVDYQVNLEPVIETPNGAEAFPAPVGIKFWISPGDYWYGGVFITRYLNGTENLQTQIWCGNLSGITLAPVAPFDPLDLFLPGDIGGFYNTNDMGSLFQTSAGPVVPVTADGDIVQFIVDQDGQFDLSRTAAGDSAVFENGLLVFDPARTNGRMSLRSGNIPGPNQVTIVCGAYINFAEGTPNNNNSLVQLALLNALGTAGCMVDLAMRTSNTLWVQLWTGAGFQRPPDQPLPPSDQPFCFGGRFNSLASEQQVFLNDDVFDLTSAYSPPGTVTFRIQSFLTPGQTVPFTGLGPTFFINRLLSDTELARLKTWMRENTPTP